ncbi:MAG: glycosyltransferase family 4 protein [Deltaproteobacteria bacterium]|nr:glycosyltransferase family 4 protein [Deltaproteobacteria bacterium]
MAAAPSKKRIALFQYNWALQSYSRDLACKLAETGYHVDFFINNYCFKRRLIDLASLSDKPGITLHRLENPSPAGWAAKKLNTVLAALPAALARPLCGDSKLYRTVRYDTIKKAIHFAAPYHNDYLCCIGIEKPGFLWAGAFAEALQIPLLYYSLELYIEGHPSIRHYTKMRPHEKKYHRQAAATIIQDRFRARVLLESNGVTDQEVLLLPVSVRGPRVTRRSTYFHDKFNLEPDTKIVLYFGRMTKERHYAELVQTAAALPENQVMVFHGYGNEKFIARLQAAAPPQKVFFSLDLVPEETLTELICSADIGLALYDNSITNDRLTAYASQKIAQYVQAGVPIIAFQNESYDDLQNRFRCCELINAISDIPAAAQTILKNYTAYRNQAFDAYDHSYNFDAAFVPVKEYIAARLT